METLCKHLQMFYITITEFNRLFHLFIYFFYVHHLVLDLGQTAMFKLFHIPSKSLFCCKPLEMIASWNQSGTSCYMQAMLTARDQSDTLDMLKDPR